MMVMLIVVVVGLMVAGVARGKPVTEVKMARECVKGNPSFNDTAYYADAYTVIRNGNYGQLMATLSATISGHVVFDYTCCWTILEEADEDPNNSQNIKGWFSGEIIDKADRDTGTETYVWNREHLWPSSHGFSSNSATAYTDVHHLRACQKQVNSARGDKDARYDGSPVCIWPYGASSNCNVYWLSQTSSVEVPLPYRGDTARALFYMATRYMDGDNGTGALALVNAVTQGMGQPRMGWLCDLVGWSADDPVDAAELKRNEIAYQWQENRNPFVDHPEWVSFVFDSC